jgi:hypothetical protein
MTTRGKQLSFGYIKAEGIGNQCETEVRKLLGKSKLETVWETDVFMSYIKLREHQPILFDLRGELNDIWKIQGAARLIGTTVRTFGVFGDNAISRLMDIKMTIRSQFAVPCEFDRENEISYPNFMHAADDEEQVEQDVRILTPSHLAFCVATNGSHKLTRRVW